MESEKKNGLFVIIALVVVALLVWWLWPTSSGPGSGQAVGDDSGQSTQASTPPPPPQLAPELQLTADEKAGNIADKKARILALVHSGKKLTTEEKAEIGGIILAKSAVYKFTEAERVAIFEALSK